jgi:hypothetical protein
MLNAFEKYSGAALYPNLHPVIANDFENPFTTIVLSHMFGNDAAETCSFGA